MSQERLEMLMRQFTEPGIRYSLNELAITAAINMPFETYSALLEHERRRLQCCVRNAAARVNSAIAWSLVISSRAVSKGVSVDREHLACREIMEALIDHRRPQKSLRTGKLLSCLA